MAGRERGYFLLEGLLAAALLGVGLLGVLGLEAAALRNRGAARENLEALALAMGSLEAAGPGGEADPGPLGPAGAWPGPGSQGRAPFGVTVVHVAEPAGVSVRVAWGGGQGARSLTLSRRAGF